MIDPKNIDELTQRISSLMPASAARFQEEIEKNLKSGLKGVLQKMDLVTREEYEVQTAILNRARARLAELEQRISSLEQKIDQ
ncbi:MAG TPA: accessory factor UbiK family protein [Gammaproteobacteria bacterium]|nr:accessory factor UbiK family protein [Gammaproteobacteria bacterium]